MGMADPVRVMVEQGKKKKAVASAFDWPGWDRSAKTEDGALTVLATYRQRASTTPGAPRRGRGRSSS